MRVHRIICCYKNKMFPIVSYIDYVFKYHTCKTPSMNEISVTFFIALHQKNWSYTFIKMKYIFIKYVSIDNIFDVC